MAANKPSRSFAIIFVLGAPAAGKGTICASLSREHNLAHYSTGDDLREFMRDNSNIPLAIEIKDKLDNQGFLSSDLLNPFICRSITSAMSHDQTPHKGVLIDGYPRCMEQLESFDTWPFERELPLAPRKTDVQRAAFKPDIVLSLKATRSNIGERYLKRGRDGNDGKEKFERRFSEYLTETVPVEEVYRRRGILIEVRKTNVKLEDTMSLTEKIDANGTEEENADEVTRKLRGSKLWQRVIVEENMDLPFLI